MTERERSATRRERLTPWFPPNVKPVNRGWYDATIFSAPKFLPPRFYWNGEVWWNGDTKMAVQNQHRFWRGLARTGAEAEMRDKLCCLCASWIAADCLDYYEGEPCHKICKAEGVGKAYKPRVPEIGDGNWICLKGDHDGAHFEIMTGGGIKIEVGGSVHVRTAREWHDLAVRSLASSATTSTTEQGRTPSEGEVSRIVTELFESVDPTPLVRRLLRGTTSPFHYWQRVDVKPPDESGWYHVWAPHGKNRQYECVEKAYFNSTSGIWTWAYGYPITHWNFMPSAPREADHVPF